jgi:hypothetical protein
MPYKIVGKIAQVEAIFVGKRIRSIQWLRRG